jgi:hypothetical protein
MRSICMDCSVGAMHRAQVPVKLRVGMTCSGCENAVKRILGKVEGEAPRNLREMIVRFSSRRSVGCGDEPLGKDRDL